MKKRLLGFIMGALLVFTCFGCGAKTTSTEPTETASATTDTEENTQTAISEEATSENETKKETSKTIATEEPIKEATDESSSSDENASESPETPSEESVSEQEETSTSQANASATSTPEPVPEPQAVYTYTDMAVTMYTTQTVNIRNLPNTDGTKLGSLSSGQEVAVTGQCNETGWYMFDYNGQVAFVSNSYLSLEKAEVPPQTNSTTTVTDTFPYELYVMYYDNMGYPYFYYIGLNTLYNTPENQAKERACRDAQAYYVFDHFQREDGSSSFNPYWGPVGKHKYQGDSIYVEFIDECNVIHTQIFGNG